MAETEGLCLAMPSVRPNMAEQRLFIRPNMTEQKPSVQPNRTEQRPSVRFCLTERCRKEGGRWGPERADAGEPKGRRKRADAGELGGAGRAHAGSGGRVLGKGEETEGRGTVPKRRKGAVPERRWRGEGARRALLGREGDGGDVGREEKTGAASEGGEEGVER